MSGAHQVQNLTLEALVIQLPRFPTVHAQSLIEQSFEHKTWIPKTLPMQSFSTIPIFGTFRIFIRFAAGNLDCLIAWTLLTPSTRRTFRLRVDVDEGTWTRGRAWALSIALVALPYYRDTNEQITAWAKHAIAQVIDDIRTEP
ncbi:hypothetical protein rerp_15080 [Rhodococcus erythropolis]|nr:hypothetical protein rerp_15080 [Rhodococcus erythropolis]